MANYYVNMQRWFLPRVVCLLGLCLSAFCAADTVSTFQSKPARLSGIIPIETKDLASFMEFGLRVMKAKTGAEVMKLWRRYDISNENRKSEHYHAIHGWIEAEIPTEREKFKTTASAKWIPKDPHSADQTISRLQPDERALITAVVDRARIETGLTKVTGIELSIGRYSRGFVNPRGFENYSWEVSFEDVKRSGTCAVGCVPASVNGDRGIRLGKSRVYISRFGDLTGRDGKPVKEFNKWSKTLEPMGSGINTRVE